MYKHKNSLKNILFLLASCLYLPILAVDQTGNFTQATVINKFESPMNVDVQEVAFFIESLASNNPNFTLNEIYENIGKQLTIKDSEDPMNSREAANMHVATKLNKIFDNFENCQDHVLSHDLKHLGIKIVDGQSGYQTLQRVSRSNAKRLKSKWPLKNTLTEIEKDIINGLEFQPGHYSQAGHQGSKLAILSSRVLKDINVLPYGHNSSNDFNREFIKSDQNVFFFPMSYDIRASTRYGSIPNFLHKDYALAKAWVSPTTMDPIHLFSLTNEQQISKSDLDSKWKEEKFQVILQQALLKLQNMVFSFEDYKNLSQYLLTVHLEEQKEKNTDLYNEHLGYLKHRKNVRNVMKEVNKMMGIPAQGGFELKVPVAVPRKYIF